MGRTLRALCVALVVGGILAGAAEAREVRSAAAETASVRHAISWQRARTWHWESAAGVHRSPAIRGVARYHSTGYLHWIERRWNHRRLRAYKLAHRPSAASEGDMGAWLCIHSGEGAWDSIGYVHGVATYFGGLQMDMGFQETYGAEFLKAYGTANHWPIADQIIAARRARDGYHGYGARGYGPWPNTGRDCGLT